MQDKISTGGNCASRLKQRLHQIWEEFFKWFQEDESIYFPSNEFFLEKNHELNSDFLKLFFGKKDKLYSEFLEDCFFAKPRDDIGNSSDYEEKHGMNSEFLEEFWVKKNHELYLESLTRRARPETQILTKKVKCSTKRNLMVFGDCFCINIPVSCRLGKH